MFGFNWIDLIILVFVAFTILEGYRLGLFTQLFVAAGFFVALFAAGWLVSYLLPISDQTLKTTINTGLVLLVALYASVRCFDIGQSLHWSFRLGRLRSSPVLKRAESLLGGLAGLAVGLILAWLLGAAVSRLPFEGLSNSTSHSRTLIALIDNLPPVPAVFEHFNYQVDHNSQPYVFHDPPPYDDFEYDAATVSLAATKARASVVRITSFGCGGIVGGTGFVVGPQLVATNAHVVAGLKRPIVKYEGSSYDAQPVHFDPALDLAILRVERLNAPALLLPADNIALDSTVAIPGYPGGNYRTVAGIVRFTESVSARSIYDQGVFGRGIYVVQAHIEHGNSGSPVVDREGRAVGIIFSKSSSRSDNAYAVTSYHVLAALRQAEAAQRRVGVGACMVQ